MDENPYQAPLEACGRLPAEHDDWSARLRRWAIGPRVPLAWFAVAGAIAILLAALLR